MPYFDEPVGRVKIQTTSQNMKRYYTTNRLIRDLLSNTPNCYVRAGELRGYLFTGNASQEYAKPAERNLRGKFHWRPTAFLRSIYLINLDQYWPAILTLRLLKNNLICLPIFS